MDYIFDLPISEFLDAIGAEFVEVIDAVAEEI